MSRFIPGLAMPVKCWKRYIAVLEIPQGGFPHRPHRPDKATLADEQSVGDLDHQRIWPDMVSTLPQQSCEFEFPPGIFLCEENQYRRRRP